MHKPELAKAILKKINDHVLQDLLQDAHEDHHVEEGGDEGLTFNIQVQEGQVWKTCSIYWMVVHCYTEFHGRRGNL